MSYTILQLLLISIYFWIKHKRIVNILNTHLGVGDILVLFALGVYFHPVNFFVYLVLSLVFVLVIHLALVAIGMLQDKRIPLAGYLSSFFLFLQLATYINRDINILDDQWIVNWIF